VTQGPVPAGWDSNPSAWSERGVLIGLAIAGAVVAGYLTLVQVGVLDHAWEPFFGAGSERVLHSSFSRALPLPDAALGLVAYLADVVLGVLGGVDRWRRRPGVTLLFSAVVVGSALGGLGLVVVQATVVHQWCTLCLASAGISVVILGVSRLREARAAVAHRRCLS